MCVVGKRCTSWCVRSRVKDFRVHLTQACGWWGESDGLRATQPQGLRAPISESGPQIRQYQRENSDLFRAATTNPVDTSRDSVWSLSEATGQREANPLAANRQAESARVTRNLRWLGCRGPQTVAGGQGSYSGVGHDTGSRIWVQLQHCLWLISWLTSTKEPTPTRFTLLFSEKMSPVTVSSACSLTVQQWVAYGQVSYRSVLQFLQLWNWDNKGMCSQSRCDGYTSLHT